MFFSRNAELIYSSQTTEQVAITQTQPMGLPYICLITLGWCQGGSFWGGIYSSPMGRVWVMIGTLENQKQV